MPTSWQNFTLSASHHVRRKCDLQLPARLAALLDATHQHAYTFDVERLE